MRWPLSWGCIYAVDPWDCIESRSFYQLPRQTREVKSGVIVCFDHLIFKSAQPIDKMWKEEWMKEYQRSSVTWWFISELSFCGCNDGFNPTAMIVGTVLPWAGEAERRLRTTKRIWRFIFVIPYHGPAQYGWLGPDGPLLGFRCMWNH